MKHISIIGTGSVGSTLAYAFLLKNISPHVQLIDIDEKRCRGELLDLSDALAFSHTSLSKSNSIKDALNSRIIIITAGQRQRPGQSRAQLYDANKKIISSIMSELKSVSPQTIIIMVSNPLDLLTLQAQKESSLPQSQIFGAGTFLDTQRLRGLLAQKLDISRKSIHAYILGEHGETQFPAWSSAHVAGIPLTQLINQKEREQIAQETKDKALDIIACKGATYWGIATCTAQLCRTILCNQKQILPLSVYLKQFDVCLSMPVVLGENGIEKIMDIPLNETEQKQLALSVQAIKSVYKA